MVTRKDNKYRCDECNLWYEELGWAEKCQEWCKENNSCNLKIIKHAIKGDK